MCFSISYTVLMVGFNQSAYVFNEEASSGQVCISYAGELAATVSLSLGLMLVEELADGTFINLCSILEYRCWHC